MLPIADNVNEKCISCKQIKSNMIFMNSECIWISMCHECCKILKDKMTLTKNSHEMKIYKLWIDDVAAIKNELVVFRNPVNCRKCKQSVKMLFHTGSNIFPSICYFCKHN